MHVHCTNKNFVHGNRPIDIATQQIPVDLLLYLNDLCILFYKCSRILSDHEMASNPPNYLCSQRKLVKWNCLAANKSATNFIFSFQNWAFFFKEKNSKIVVCYDAKKDFDRRGDEVIGSIL